MTREEFFEKFELIAELPDAVAKMRELVLRLAFSGRFTTAGHTDLHGPWQARTIGDLVVSITPGFACSKSHQVVDGHVHLRTHNISVLGSLNFDLLVRIDRAKVDPAKSSLRRGDILFNNTNSQELVGKTSFVDRDHDFGFSNHLTRLRLNAEADPRFVTLYLTLLRNSGHFAAICTRWINQAAINTDALKRVSIPLPPLDEQKRIAAKVDELMVLCDRLEAQQKERETRHGALARASLTRFRHAPSPANLKFIFQKLYEIGPTELRKRILALAVQGKLVPGASNAEPSTFGAILAEASVNGVSKGPTTDTSATEVLRISAGTSRDDYFVDENDYKYVELPPSEINKYRLAPGDLLACRFNGNLHYVGRFSYYRADSKRTQVNPDKLIRFRIDAERHCPRYVCYAMNAEPTRELIEAQCATTAGNIGISASRLKSVSIRLPSLTEQRRIVAKIDELMALVEALECQLTAAYSTGRKLLDAIVAELTSNSPRAESLVAS